MQIPNYEMNRVYDWVAKHATFTPDKLALVETATARRFTYRQFDQEANRVANFLEQLGIKAGDRVAIIAPSCVEILFTLFGATKIGAIFIPLNNKLTSAELVPIVQNCEPAVLIYADEFGAAVSELRQQFQFQHTIKLGGKIANDELDWTRSLASVS